VFVLDTIIKYQQHQKKPVFLCFVDFTKAIDYINRNALYYKLHKQKMGTKMLRVIMSMFDKAQAKVYQLGEVGDPVDSIFGVLQGGILSPKLFNEFMSDLPKYLNIKDGIKIDDTHFTHLLYADDIVLISESATGLQNSIDSLHNFCSKWHLIVNISKTKVMKIDVKNPDNLKYNGQIIENVGSYKYLGHLLSDKKGTHDEMSKYLITQAQKALFALQGKMSPSLGHISPLLAIKMFDSYILPILEYNSMLWSRHSQIPDVEKIQLRYLKHILNVRRQTPTLAVYAETGRFPLIIRQKLTTVNYWARLAKLPNYDILNKCLKVQEKLHEKGQRNWYSKVMDIITQSKVSEWQMTNLDSLIKTIKLNLYMTKQSRILNETNDSGKLTKLRTYKIYKTTYCLEPYLKLLIFLRKHTII